MGSFITNLLKLNARQLLNKKVKRNKTANSTLSSRTQYGSTSSIHSATTNRGGSSTSIYLNSSKQNKSQFSPTQTPLIITSPLTIQQIQRNKSSYKSQSIHENLNRNGPSPNSSGYFNNIDLFLNGNEDDFRKLPSIFYIYSFLKIKSVSILIKNF